MSFYTEREYERGPDRKAIRSFYIEREYEREHDHCDFSREFTSRANFREKTARTNFISQSDCEVNCHTCLCQFTRWDGFVMPGHEIEEIILLIERHSIIYDT
jgi:hypothetical protein